METNFMEAEDLWLRYGRGEAAYDALRGVNLRIGRGEFVAIVGPSGSGKSSLLHILGLMLNPTRAGKFILDGETLAGADANGNAVCVDEATRTRIRKHKIGFVFQRLNLVPVLSAADNVRLAFWLRGQQPNGQAETLLDLLGVGQIRHKRPGQMSVGQQQRVAVARAIAGSPQLLLADEPTGSLDSANSRLVLDLFRQVHRQGGGDLTTVIVTHNQEVAVAADRIIHIHDGQVVHEPIDANP